MKPKDPSPRFFALPHTRLGRWSMGLMTAFFALFASWLTYVNATPMDRPTFFSDPLHAVLILSAAASAIAGAFAGTFAVGAKRERSGLVFASILTGAFVLYWALAEALGGH